MTATDGELLETSERAIARYERRLGADFWSRIGGDRDDALQSALIRCWKASQRHDGSAPIKAWLYRNAKFGLSDYIRERRADLDKRSPTRLVKVGLDDEPVAQHYSEVSIDDEDFPEQPQPEVSRSEVETEEERQHIRRMLDIALVGALEDRERRAVRLYYGFDAGAEHNDFRIARKLRVSVGEAMELRYSGLNKLRAEFRANEILGL